MTTAVRPAIHAEGLGRTFGETTALSGVDLEVRPGEVHALLGPNGAGKTTLLRIIVGSVRPTSGSVTVAGVPWERLERPESRTLFGLVSAGERSSYHRLSGLENLIFFGRLYGLSKRAAQHRAEVVLERVGLTDAARRPSGGYSHGMQKRLTIARALLMDPPVLLVDEATHDLDPAGARMVRALLTEAAHRGAAVLWATQRVDEIRGTADLVTVLDRGSVRFCGSIEELTRSDQSRYRIAVAPGAAHPDDLAGGIDLEPVGDSSTFLLTVPDGVSLGEAISLLQDRGIDVVSCHMEGDVEEAFLALTSRPAEVTP